MPGLGKHVSDTEGESWGQLSFIILNRKGGGTFLRNNLAATNFYSDYNNAADCNETLHLSRFYAAVVLYFEALKMLQVGITIIPHVASFRSGPPSQSDEGCQLCK